MPSKLPRIEAVRPEAPGTLHIDWWNGGSAVVDLQGWIAAGGEQSAELTKPEMFSQAAIGHFGTAIVWGDEDGDLAIDAFHLQRLAELQRPFKDADLRIAQEELRLSNAEFARLLGIGKTQFAAYRSGAQTIPTPVAITVRAMKADPVILHAHLRPSRPPGRPRKSAA